MMVDAIVISAGTSQHSLAYATILLLIIVGNFALLVAEIKMQLDASIIVTIILKSIAEIAPASSLQRQTQC
jgi:hypothetical protein